MNLTISSKSKTEKTILVVKSKKKKLYPAHEDVLQKLSELIDTGEINLKDIKQVNAEVTQSFTGTRQSYNIANTLNYYLLKKPYIELEFPNYHKEPNINIGHKVIP